MFYVGFVRNERQPPLTCPPFTPSSSSAILYTVTFYPITAPALLDSSSGDIRGRFRGDRVAAERLYGARARQCYRLFCSKQ